ncbi:hypothetical protein J6590_071496 [Homalodisca vitripennis]|nr:hypothetical protein J6590_071496 [Homalodisca vitripennis]
MQFLDSFHVTLRDAIIEGRITIQRCDTHMSEMTTTMLCVNSMHTNSKKKLLRKISDCRSGNVIETGGEEISEGHDPPLIKDHGYKSIDLITMHIHSPLIGQMQRGPKWCNKRRSVASEKRSRGPPPIKIHEEELDTNLKVMSPQKKGRPALNQPLQSKQAGGGTPLLRLARSSDT